MGLGPDIITIGESLIELSSKECLKEATKFDKHYGGDSLVSAISALRLGSSVGFITKVGTDSFCDFLTQSWQNEGLDISHAIRSEGYNGLYFVSLTDEITREFVYYRRKTATAALSVDDIDPEYIKNAKCIYATGLTQSLSNNCKDAIKFAFKTAKEAGVSVAYAPNYSHKIWDKDEALEAFNEISEYIDIIFLDLKYDVKSLFGIESAQSAIKRLCDQGISNVIISDNGYWAGDCNDIVKIERPNSDMVDETGAQDSFNGAYLHGFVKNMNKVDSVSLASIVASLQSQNLGAVRSLPDKNQVLEHFKNREE